VPKFLRTNKGDLPLCGPGTNGPTHLEDGSNNEGLEAEVGGVWVVLSVLTKLLVISWLLRSQTQLLKFLKKNIQKEGIFRSFLIIC
jgi:hypothetical protein